MLMYSTAWDTCIFYDDEYCCSKLKLMLICGLNALNVVGVKKISFFF
ncbi:hypothetical protein BH10BAC2_BH10BAC2_37450 [soil metagenome]